MQSDTPNKSVEASCPGCWKPASICLCAEIRPLKCRTRILILQHPQEARNPLGTARLLSQSVPGAVHKVGLSWRSFSAALGVQANPSEWAVLFLGPLKESSKLNPDLPFQIVEKTGKRVPLDGIRGIVLLDGNWKQSKTLWWRNPWLLKLKRIVLNPAAPSRYGSVRRQPRRHCLSTIEAAAESLAGFGEPAAISEGLSRLFDKHLERVSVRAVPVRAVSLSAPLAQP